MITIVSMSRRPELYKSFVEHIEEIMSSLVTEFLVFVNDENLYPQYVSIANSNSKVKILKATEDFVYKYGHDTVYNYLDNKASNNLILKLFDTDTVEVDTSLLKKELEQDLDVYGMQTYMERGDVWETKYQLYKKGILKWYGLVHENQHFDKSPKSGKLLSLKIWHRNAIDKESTKLKKTEDGFIILEKTIEGTDSDRRNLLYETLAWKIVNENGRQDALAWFERHYQINKEIIDWYYQRAKERYNL